MTCEHCGYAKAPDVGACTKCGFDPADPQDNVFDKPQYRAKAVLMLLAAFAGIVWTAAYLIKNPGPPRTRKPLPPSSGPQSVSVTDAGAGSPAWQFYGRVFDLKTLQPLGNIVLEFRSPRATVFQAVSDASGYYKIDLPAMQGAYELRTAAPGYSRDFAGDAEAFRKMGDKRLQLASRPEAFDEVTFHPPWVGLPGRPISRDVLLLKDAVKR